MALKIVHGMFEGAAHWGAPMSNALTCWKEIAQYLGKGVRTVQRWEQELGLPVRRPPGHDTRVVLAFSDEIDAWMSSRFEDRGKPELEVLRKELAEARKENQLLRAKLEGADRAATFVRLNAPVDLERWIDDWLQKRCFLAVVKSSKTRLKAAELIDKARFTRELCRMQREQGVKPSYEMLIH